MTFNVPVSATATFTFINYSEQGYDFGVFGELDTALNHNYYAAGSSGANITDSDYKLACNTSTYNNTSTHTLEYTMSAGEHFVDVKYSKDDASDDNDDTLKFKVSVTLNESYSPTPYYVYEITNIQGDHTIVVMNMETNTLYIKKNGSWVEVVKAYKKQNGSWVEVEIDSVFNSTDKYVCGD